MRPVSRLAEGHPRAPALAPARTGASRQRRERRRKPRQITGIMPRSVRTWPMSEPSVTRLRCWGMDVWSATPVETRALFRQERSDLLALLDELSPRQWAAPSAAGG